MSDSSTATNHRGGGGRHECRADERWVLNNTTTKYCGIVWMQQSIDDGIVVYSTMAFIFICYNKTMLMTDDTTINLLGKIQLLRCWLPWIWTHNNQLEVKQKVRMNKYLFNSLIDEYYHELVFFFCPSHVKYWHAICPPFLPPIRPLQVIIFDCSFLDASSYLKHNPHRRGFLLHLSFPLVGMPVWISSAGNWRQLAPTEIPATFSVCFTDGSPITIPAPPPDWVLFTIGWGGAKQYMSW